MPAEIAMIEDDPRFATAQELWQVAGLTYEFMFITEKEARDWLAKQPSLSPIIMPTITRCPRIKVDHAVRT